jgi:hypothetical protein
LGNGEVVLPLAVSVVAGVDLFLDLDGEVAGDVPVRASVACEGATVPAGEATGVAVGGEEVGMPVGGAVSAGGVPGVVVGSEEVGMPVGGAVSAGGVPGVVVGNGELP